MAKRQSRQTETETGEEAASSAQPGQQSAAEERILDFAEDLGRLLGTAERKANEWLGQRQEVVKTLTQLRDSATQLLEKLQAGAATQAARRGRKPGRPGGAASASAPTQTASASDASPTRRRNFKMSAAQKKAVGERMRKYWAARRKAEGRK